MSIRQWLTIPLLLALPLFSACGRESQTDSAQTAAKPPEKAVNVVVATVVPENLEESFTLPGTLEAWEDLTLAAELAGPVRWVGAREGEGVRQGEVLLRIDPEGVDADQARAQAEFDLRQKQLERMRQLASERFVSQQELDQARQAFEAAQAELQRARVAAAKSSLCAPVAGILDCLLVDRGEYVNEGAPVAILVQVDRLKVLVEVPEKDVGFLRVGQKVRVFPAAIAGEAGPERSGEIIHLAYKADPLSRTYLAKVAVDNRGGELRPGMIVRVGFARRELRQVIAIPLYALVDRDGAKLVFVEEGGVAHRRQVTPAAVVGDRVVLDEGLAPGERLIVRGQQLLADGASVTVVEGEK